MAGDAALLVSPRDPDEIAHAMERVYADSDFRESLIRKGNLRKDAFGWDRTARLLQEAIQRVV